MRICIARESEKFAWHKGGQNITYGKGRVVRKRTETRVSYYSQLSFEVTLNSPEDKIYFAYAYPYTFSRL